MKTPPLAVVTGGAGFIGSHMVDLLISEGFEVRVIDNLTGGRRKNIEHHEGNKFFHFEEKDLLDLTEDCDLFENASYVFHFAGLGDIVPSIDRPVDYFETNVQGTAKVLNCAFKHKVKKFVYAASSSCYGVAQTPTSEDHVLDPLYPYALSKLMGEQLTMHWHNVYGLPVTSLRIFNAYGPRSRTSGSYGAVFGVFLKQKIESKPFTVVGDGSQKRDFLYVTDLVEAFLLAAKSEKQNSVYNLGAGLPEAVNTLVELIGGEVIYIPKRPGEPDCTWADIEKIGKDLGWKPKITLKDGVSRMLENLDYWREAPLWDEKKIDDATSDWFKFLGK